MELLRAAEILIDKIKKDYKEDVACVVVMGSHLYNATHSKSDLDLYFVVNSDRGFNPGMAFIIDGIGFDFWPISWKRLEKIANHDEKITSIITEGKVLYYSSEEDLERFNNLKEKALDVSDKPKFLKKAQEKLNETYKTYFRLLKAETLTEARKNAMGIISSLTYSIALLNRITVKRGRGQLKQEIMDMPLVPGDFETLYDTVFVSTDISVIKEAYGQLISNTEELISSEQAKEMSPLSFVDNLSGFYEELINFYNKIERACEIGDRVTPMFAATEIAYEIEMAFAGTGVSTKQLPDLVGVYDPENLTDFLEVASEHQKQFVELLENKGVKLTEFRDFDELERYMESL